MEAKLVKWAEVPTEELNPTFFRKALHTGGMTIAVLELKKGGVVPQHQHINEQVSLVETGKIVFHFPDRDVEVGPGETLVIPPNLPHGVTVLEDSKVMDLFTPLREDWLTGNDAYLRK